MPSLDPYVEGTLSLETAISSSYLRTRNNNLRCFPRCSPFHLEQRFCGRGLELTVSSVPKEKIQETLVFIEFRNETSTSTFRLGEACGKSMVVDAIKRSGKFVLAEKVKEIENGGYRFVVPPPRKWHYPGKVNTTDQHVVQMYLVVDGKICVMSTSSAFQVIPIWKLDEKSAGEVGDMKALGATGVSNQVEKRPVAISQDFSRVDRKSQTKPSTKIEIEPSKAPRLQDVSSASQVDGQESKKTGKNYSKKDDEEEGPMTFKCNLPPTLLNVMANEQEPRPASNRPSQRGLRAQSLPAGLTLFVDPGASHQSTSIATSSAYAPNVQNPANQLPQLSRLPRMELSPGYRPVAFSFHDQYFAGMRQSTSLSPDLLGYSWSAEAQAGLRSHPQTVRNSYRNPSSATNPHSS